jgi:Ni/Co efflux regulator RcnB
MLQVLCDRLAASSNLIHHRRSQEDATCAPCASQAAPLRSAQQEGAREARKNKKNDNQDRSQNRNAKEPKRKADAEGSKARTTKTGASSLFETRK